MRSFLRQSRFFVTLNFIILMYVNTLIHASITITKSQTTTTPIAMLQEQVISIEPSLNESNIMYAITMQSLLKINTDQHKIINRLDLGGSGTATLSSFALSPDGSELYLADFLERSIKVVDLKTLQVSSEIKLPYAPGQIKVTKNNLLYTTQYFGVNPGSDNPKLMIVDLTTKTYKNGFLFGPFDSTHWGIDPGLIELNHDKTKLYYASYYLGLPTLSQFNISGQEPVLEAQSNIQTMPAKSQIITALKTNPFKNVLFYAYSDLRLIGTPPLLRTNVRKIISNETQMEDNPYTQTAYAFDPGPAIAAQLDFNSHTQELVLNDKPGEIIAISEASLSPQTHVLVNDPAIKEVKSLCLDTSGTHLYVATPLEIRIYLIRT